MEVTGGGRLPIGSLLSAIPGINIRSLPLPPGLRKLFNLQIDSFSLDTNSKKLEIDTKLPATLRYFNGYLSITNPAIKLHAVLKRPRQFTVEVNGTIKVGKGAHDITIKRNPFSSKYILRAFFKAIPISDFIRKFSASISPAELQSGLRSFLKFSIHNAKLAFPIGTKKLQIHLSGTPVIGGYRTVHMSAVIIRQGGQTKMIEGFSLGKVSLATLIQKITRKNLRRIAILNQNLDTTLVISPVTLPGVHLHGSKLKDISITKGVTIHASLKWPQDCARDKFCSIAQKRLGKDAMFSLQGTVVSAKAFTLSAGVSNVRLGSGVVLQRAALQVKVGVETSVGIEGSIHLKNPGITFTAGLRVGTRGVVLEGSMQGCWKRAFGAKWLSICNLHLLIGIQPTVTIVGALEIGGQVRIGDPSCIRNPIIGSGYVGIDQLSPRDNFYYLQLKNKFTVERVLRAFCIKIPLPRPLAESGFPKGFLSSFSIAGKELPRVDISIPAGFHLKATINILGLVAHAEVTISFRGVKMSIELEPLRILGGRLKLYASSKDQKRGPFLKARIMSRPRPDVDIHASGFVSVLGIEIETMMRITNTQYEFRIRGKLLHLFDALLHITASYENIKQASFRVRGYLRNNFFVTIRNKILNALQNSARAATKAIDNAQRKVNSKKVLFDRAIAWLSSVQQRVNSANYAFNRADHNLRRWEAHVRNMCQIRRCSYGK